MLLNLELLHLFFLFELKAKTSERYNIISAILKFWKISLLWKTFGSYLFTLSLNFIRHAAEPGSLVDFLGFF